MYFYTVYPDNQDQIEFTTTDIINFNGRLVVFDIMEGYKERIQYVDGELKNYYSGGDLILSRGEIEFPNWWAPRRVAGHGWSWNPNDNGGCCCGAQCGGSNCGPCNGSGGNDTGIDINIINIPGKPGWLIHGNGSNSSGGTGGSGSSAGSSAGGGTNGNPKNPIDEAGLDEIRRQQFVTKVCEYADHSTSGCSCQQLITVIDIACLDAPDFFSCAAASDDCDPSDFTEEDECTGAIALFEATYGLTLTVKEKRAIRRAINDNDDVSCGGEGFEEEAIGVLISETFNFDLDELPPGVKIRLLDCSSFEWTQVGSGWISCINPTNMEIEIGNTNITYDIELGCMSYTVPMTRVDENGNVIQTFTSDEASGCAALASNLASIAVKLFMNIIPEHKLFNPDFLVKQMMRKAYKKAYEEAIELTECGSLGSWSGSIASCDTSGNNCPAGSNPGQYSDNIVEVTRESLIGGCN